MYCFVSNLTPTYFQFGGVTMMKDACFVSEFLFLNLFIYLNLLKNRRKESNQKENRKKGCHERVKKNKTKKNRKERKGKKKNIDYTFLIKEKKTSLIRRKENGIDREL